MNLSPLLRQRFFDANGVPLAGGLLYSYAAGTTTPQATYSNATGTTNTNPVVLDSTGYADVWLDPSLAYKFILQDVNGNLQWSVDNVIFAVGITTWNSNSVYQQGSIVVDSSGQGLLYVSLINNNQNNQLNNPSAWRVYGGNVRTVTANTALLVTDDLIRSNSASGDLVHTLPACSTTPIGKRITVKDVGSAGNYTQVKGSGTDQIDGANTYGTNLIADQSATFENNGASWDVLGIAADGSINTTKISATAGILGSQLAASAGIVGTQLAASAGIVGTQLAASAGIVGTQLTTSINLPGKPTIGSGTSYPVVCFSNPTMPLAVIRGQVSSSGGINYGEGFTVVRNTTGTYTFGWATMGDVPAVTVSIADNAAAIIAVSSISVNGCVVTFGTAASSGVTLVDHNFSIIAIGQL